MIFHYVKNVYDFFIGFSIGLLLNDFFDRRFPNQYKIFSDYLTNLFVNVSFNCIYYYTKCQIFFTTYIESNPIYLKIINAIQSKINKTTKKSLEVLFIKDNFHYNIPIDLPDFIITSNLSTTPVAKRITSEENYQNVVFEECNIKFMLVEFQIGEKLYKIDLKTDKYNYYMIDNKFTKDFFIFYINEYLLTKYEQHEVNKYEKYILKIIDNDVNKVEIVFTDKNESILLEKNGYKLTITNHKDSE
jgi:hypothetical protein